MKHKKHGSENKSLNTNTKKGLIQSSLWQKELQLRQQHQEKKTPPKNQFIAPSPITLKPGYKTALLLLLLLGSTIADTNQATTKKKYSKPLSGHHKNSIDQITEKLEGQFNLSPELQNNLNARLFCNELSKSVIDLAKKWPNQISNILGILSANHNGKPLIRFVCTTEERIIQANNRGGDALLDYYTGDVLIAASETANDVYQPKYSSGNHLNLLSHQFFIANVFLRQKACGEDALQPSLPIFSPTVEKVLRFNHALNLGDDRIKLFQELWLKNSDGFYLTTKEQKQFDIFMANSKNCLLVKLKGFLTEQNYQEMLSNGLSDNLRHKPSPIFSKNFFGSIQLLHVGTPSQMPNGSLQRPFVASTISPEQAVLLLINNPQIVSAKNYNTEPTNINVDILAHRTSYTFQTFSIEAMNYFYPEANEYIKEFEKECPINGSEQQENLELEKEVRFIL